MQVGKVSENILKRSVFKKIGHRRDEVLVGPGIGEDCAFVEINEGEVFVLSTDPITGTTKDIGDLAINITANDIASSGAEVIGVLVTILLPENTSEKELKELMIDIEDTCKKLNIEVMGGHTEVTKAVNQPVVSLTGVGKVTKQKMLEVDGPKVGQDIVFTKWAGLEGTAIIAKEKETELKERYRDSFVESAKRLDKYISVIEESKISLDNGATAMHDVTEGGIFGALWEMASTAQLGIEIYLDNIPILQETIEICELYNLNPYKLISSGCLLVATYSGKELVSDLNSKGIDANIIGKFVQSNERVVISQDKRTSLEPPKSDELYNIF